MITILICSIGISNAINEIDVVQDILNSYHFKYKPELDVFDCVDMSIANYNMFKSLGYDVRIAIKEDGYMPDGQPTGHCFAIIKLSEGWVGIETKQAVVNTSISIGKIISIPELREICNSPEEIYARDRRKNIIVDDIAIEKN
jgi:hypothetical protein